MKRISITIMLCSGIICATSLPFMKATLIARYFTSGISSGRTTFMQCYHHLLEKPSDVTLSQLLAQQTVADKTKLLKDIIKMPQVTPQAVQLLLTSGAKVNTADESGKTALHYLADSSRNRVDLSFYAQVLSIIKAYEPDFDEKDAQGKVPADYAHPSVRRLFKAPDQTQTRIETLLAKVEMLLEKIGSKKD